MNGDESTHARPDAAVTPPGTMERMLRAMTERGASDLYLSPDAPPLVRINGRCSALHDARLTPDMPMRLLRQVAPQHRVEELELSGEANFALPLAGVGYLRFSALRQRGSHAVVVRLIPSDIPAFGSLGLPDSLIDLAMARRGLVLMVGASGNGKSTTLAAMLDHRNQSEACHILTIEDPVEFQFRNQRAIVNQREVGSDTASLHVALRNAMRQAPDVILIGEIRDAETMSAAISYAQSGHLCLATLHASNSTQALNRVMSFYPPETRANLLDDLSAALRAIISQRLVGTASGKRIPAVEVMLRTELVGEMIRKGEFSSIKETMEKSLTAGSQTFEQDLARLVRAGLVERAEALAHADSATNLIWRLQNDAAPREPRPLAFQAAAPAPFALPPRGTRNS